MRYDTTATQGENCTDDLIDHVALREARWYPSKPVRCSDSDCGCKRAQDAPQSVSEGTTPQTQIEAPQEVIGCCIGPEVADPTNAPCALVESLRQPEGEPDWVRDAMQPPEPHELPYAWAAKLAPVETDPTTRWPQYRDAALGQVDSYTLPTPEQMEAAQVVAAFLGHRMGKLRQVFIPQKPTKRWSGLDTEPTYHPTTLRARRERVDRAYQFVFNLCDKFPTAMLFSNCINAVESAAWDLCELKMDSLDQNRITGQARLLNYHRDMFALGCEMAGFHEHAVLRDRFGDLYAARHALHTYSTPRLHVTRLTRAGVGKAEADDWQAWRKIEGDDYDVPDAADPTKTLLGVQHEEGSYRPRPRSLQGALRDFEPTGFKAPVPIAALMMLHTSGWNDDV